MDTFLWLLLFTSTMMLVFRWMLSWGTAFINRGTVRQFFLQRLAATRPDMRIIREDDHAIALQIDSQMCTVHLDQLYRRCAESPTQVNLFVRQAVAGLDNALQETDTVPNEWEQVVVPLLITLDMAHPDGLLFRPVFDTLAIGYALNMGGSFRWITQQAMTDAGIAFDHLHAIAMRNLERSCNMLVIESPQLAADGHERFVRFSTADGLDAARLLIPSFYQRFTSRFEDNDLLVAIPSRDSLAMVSTDDAALANMLAWRSAQERLHRAYPLYPLLLRVSEDGLAPWLPGESAPAATS